MNLFKTWTPLHRIRAPVASTGPRMLVSIRGFLLLGSLLAPVARAQQSVGLRKTHLLPLMRAPSPPVGSLTTSACRFPTVDTSSPSGNSFARSSASTAIGSLNSVEISSVSTASGRGLPTSPHRPSLLSRQIFEHPVKAAEPVGSADFTDRIEIHIGIATQEFNDVGMGFQTTCI